MNKITKLPLTQGKFALVDSKNFKRVNQYKWYLFPNGCGNFYAKRNVNKTTQLLHRFILNLTKTDPQVDHINGNGLDCRLKNMRLATSNLNNHNRRRLRKAKTSKYKGVSKCKQTNRWIAFLSIEGKGHNLGRYSKEKDAALAYNKAAIKLYGSDAAINIV